MLSIIFGKIISKISSSMVYLLKGLNTLLLYRFRNQYITPIFPHFLHMRSDHDCDTRNCNSIKPVQHILQTFEQSPQYMAPKVYNRFPFINYGLMKSEQLHFYWRISLGKNEPMQPLSWWLPGSGVWS